MDTEKTKQKKKALYENKKKMKLKKQDQKNNIFWTIMSSISYSTS